MIKRVRSLDTKVTNFNTDIQTLKGGQIKLESSLERTSTLDSRVTKYDQDIQTLKSTSVKLRSSLDNDIPRLKQQQNQQRNELTRIIRQTPNNQVNNQQVAQINSRLDQTNQKLDKLPDLKDISLAVAGLDILRQIKDKSGKTTCQAPALVPPVAAQTRATNATLLSFQGASLAQTTAIQKTVTITKTAVTHAKYGVEAGFKFAETAWKATRINKVLNYLSFVFTVLNAMQLSTNLAGSLGDILSGILNNSISFLKNEEFQEININETLGNTLENSIKRIIGEENYTGTSETFKKYNRIINAASNVIHSVMSIQAGLAEGLETIGNYTGRIGNALKKSGAVLENSYQWMSEKISVKTGRLGKIQRAIDLGESAENIGSDIENATSEFREVQVTTSEIGNQFNSVKKEFTSKETEKTTTEATSKANSQGAQPQLTDFVRDPIE